MYTAWWNHSSQHASVTALGQQTDDAAADAAQVHRDAWMGGWYVWAAHYHNKTHTRPQGPCTLLLNSLQHCHWQHSLVCDTPSFPPLPSPLHLGDVSTALPALTLSCSLAQAACFLHWQPQHTLSSLRCNCSTNHPECSRTTHTQQHALPWQYSHNSAVQIVGYPCGTHTPTIISGWVIFEFYSSK